MAQVTIKHLGGGDAWTHPQTGKTHKIGDTVAFDEHTSALVDDGFATIEGALPVNAPVPASDQTSTKTCAACGASWTGVNTPDVCPECGVVIGADAPAGSTAPDAEFDDASEDADDASDEEAAASAKPKKAKRGKS
jgi:hypothetical protein